MGSGDMSISAFARRSLLSVKALRLYDEMGLLRPERVDTDSRYRYYSESQLETARLISLLRKLDVPLAEISGIVSMEPAAATQILAAWWKNEEERFAGRKDLLRYIRGSVLVDEARRPIEDGNYEVVMRERPAMTWLYRSSHVHGPDLPAFIGQSVDALTKRADRYGGAQGHSVVIFHGLVDLDSNGPADVCLPVVDNSVAEDGDLIRTEAAHQQAYIVLEKHQVAFPQILQVYQSLRRWIDHNGFAISGPPREQYLGPFDVAQSDDQICEVAFPIQSAKGTRK